MTARHGQSPVRLTAAAYEADAGPYTDANADRSVIAPMLERLIAALAPGDLIVDLGCGPGWETGALQAGGFRVIGVDISQAMLRSASHAYPLAAFARGDLRRLPLPSGRFAGAWACASLLHLPKAEVATALGEIVRVLAPGGVLECSVQSGDGELVERRSIAFTRPRFYAHYRPEEWRRSLEAAGLAVEHIDHSTADAEHLNEGATGWITAIARRPR